MPRKPLAIQLEVSFAPLPPERQRAWEMALAQFLYIRRGVGRPLESSPIVDSPIVEVLEQEGRDAGRNRIREMDEGDSKGRSPGSQFVAAHRGVERAEADGSETQAAERAAQELPEAAPGEGKDPAADAQGDFQEQSRVSLISH